MRSACRSLASAAERFRGYSKRHAPWKKWFRVGHMPSLLKNIRARRFCPRCTNSLSLSHWSPCVRGRRYSVCLPRRVGHVIAVVDQHPSPLRTGEGCIPVLLGEGCIRGHSASLTVWQTSQPSANPLRGTHISLAEDASHKGHHDAPQATQSKGVAIPSSPGTLRGSVAGASPRVLATTLRR
jgi:hypothetical protein